MKPQKVQVPTAREKVAKFLSGFMSSSSREFVCLFRATKARRRGEPCPAEFLRCPHGSMALMLGRTVVLQLPLGDSKHAALNVDPKYSDPLYKDPKTGLPIFGNSQKGGCQNYGPLLGPLNTRCRIILRTQKVTIPLTTTQYD